MIWTLLPVSLIYGLTAALVFRRFSDQALIRAAINRMIAHVMEFRLFLDSPALVLRAQRDLLRENLRLLRLVLLPSAILAIIFIILFPQLDAMYGHAPLQVGEPSVVTAQLIGDAVLEAPRWNKGGDTGGPRYSRPPGQLARAADRTDFRRTEGSLRWPRASKADRGWRRPDLRMETSVHQSRDRDSLPANGCSRRELDDLVFPDLDGAGYRLSL